MATKRRIKPRISVTLEPDVYERLARVRDLIPGMTSSGVVNEVLSLSLPMLEDMGKAMREAFDDTGQLDQARARDALAKWAGAQMLDFMTEVSDAMSEKSGEEMKG